LRRLGKKTLPPDCHRKMAASFSFR
jgi:hypothetical protein